MESERKNLGYRDKEKSKWKKKNKGKEDDLRDILNTLRIS